MMEGMLQEYTTLRNELIYNFQATDAFLAISVTATAALLGYALQKEQKNWVVFLSPFGVLLPMLLLTYAKFHSTLRIATYINEYLEEQVQGLDWESRLATFRSVTALPDIAATIAISVAYGGLGVICLVLSFLHLPDERSRRNLIAYGITAVALFLPMLWILLHIAGVLGPDEFERYREWWKATQTP